jgi:hypothetical protein
VANFLPKTRRWRSAITFLKFFILTAICGLLVYQLHSYGPTIDDPDPDGYVSYAYGLTETGVIQSHRRLPGYPLIVAIIAHDEITQNAPIMSLNDSSTKDIVITNAKAVAVQMFYFHIILTVAFVICTIALIWRFFGYAVAAIYSLLIAYNSYFARNAVVMLADLPLVVVFYITCAIGLLFLIKYDSLRLRSLYAALFILVCAASIAIHPSAHMLIQILIINTAIVFGLKKICVTQQIKRLENLKRMLVPLLILSVLALMSNILVKTSLQKTDQQDYLTIKETSSSNYIRSWVGYRMLLCLPPGSKSDSLDAEIEILKSKVSVRNGYPINAVVPPGYYAEFLPFIDGKTIESDRWKKRIWEHPLTIVECAALEFRAKYNRLIKNLTPFTSFDSDKTWMTPDYPANTGSPRDKLFWSTGINLFSVLQADAPETAVSSATKLEVTRIILVIALTIGGLIMIGRRFSGVGIVMAGSLLTWICILPTAVPLETRYLMSFFPIIYTGQAILIVFLVRSAFQFTSKKLSRVL